MKKHILMIVLYLCILLACGGILFLIQSVTELKPQQTIEEEMTPETKQQTEVEIEPATPATVTPDVTDDKIASDRASTSRRSSKPIQDEQIEAEIEPEPYHPPTVIFATDLHVLAPELWDDGKAFQARVRRDDGKVLPYIEIILDVFIEEVINQQPTALVLSGDITLDGEKQSHQFLADKLQLVKDAGIQVLVIPGNHDVNNFAAMSYIGDLAEETESVTPAEFAEIYQPHGYGQAASNDESSLSYLYHLDETHWLLLLDSVDYVPRNRVSGRIRLETFEWMKEQLQAAKEAGAVIIPVAHHNLLEQSRLYVDECVLDNNDAAIWLLEDSAVSVYFSGHLHAQRIKKHQAEPGTPKEAYGIVEIVNSPLSMPPCQYGVLKWLEDDSLDYSMQKLDIEGWASAHGVEDPNLLNFNEYQEAFFAEIISDQITGNIKNLSAETIATMTQLYVSILRRYVEGQEINFSEVKHSSGYQMWERNFPESIYFLEIKDMIKDSGQNNRSWKWQSPLIE